MASDSDEIEAVEPGPENTVIDISELAPAERLECCIYRVPKQLRKVNEVAYTPKLVSVGPFHQRQEELKDMEKHRKRYLKEFLRRTGKCREDLVKIIKDDKIKILRCYSEDDLGLQSDEFVEMILLDAIFIIELFLKVKEAAEQEETDYILSKPWLGNGILHDLILLENQLPFFVLEKLYMFAFNDSSSCNHLEEGKQIEEHKKGLMEQDAPFVKLSRNYFDRYDQNRNAIIGEEVKHFTDLVRYLFCPPHMEQNWKDKMKQRSSTPEEVPHSLNKTIEESSGTRFCATKLDDAGFKFKEVKEDRCLLDITLHGVLGRGMHILKIPHLVIDGHTEAIFRNLMALEQCHYPSKTYICSYALLLDDLIDTEKDVELLVHKKVIVNQLGSNAIVMDLINKLGDHIVVTPSSYFDYIAQNLIKHYDYPWNHILATMKRVYFPNVFRGTATVFGLTILGFSTWNLIRPFAVKNKVHVV